MSTKETTETTPQEPAQAAPVAPKPKWTRFHAWLDAVHAQAKKTEQVPGSDASSET